MNDIETSRIDKIRELHADIIGAVRMTLEKAIDLGGLLKEQKAETAHGEWSTWVSDNLPFDIRTAQNYMKAYRRRDELKNENVSLLTEAYRTLEEPDGISTTDLNAIAKRVNENHRKLMDEVPQMVREFCTTVELANVYYTKLTDLSKSEIDIIESPAMLWELATLYIGDCTDVEALVEMIDLTKRITQACAEMHLRLLRLAGKTVEEIQKVFPELSYEDIANNIDIIIAVCERRIAAITQDERFAEYYERCDSFSDLPLKERIDAIDSEKDRMLNVVFANAPQEERDMVLAELDQAWKHLPRE